MIEPDSNFEEGEGIQKFKIRNVEDDDFSMSVI